MKTLLALLFLVCNLPAQFLGSWYGQGTPPIVGSCGGPITNSWIYAHGSTQIGQQLIYKTADREWWCSQNHSFLYVLAVGFSPASLVLPVSFTNTHPSTIFTSGEIMVYGTLSTSGVEYQYVVDIPNNPSIVGLDVYAQWGMLFVDGSNIPRLMLSQGLQLAVTQ